MAAEQQVDSGARRLFRDMVLGTLVYAVVLGFFEDYTPILDTWSYSVTFAAAIVMNLLTYATLKVKSVTMSYFKGREGKVYVAAMALAVWFIMFSSKFVFLFVIETIFGSSVAFSGFIGLMLVIIVATLATNALAWVYGRLPEGPTAAG